MNEKRYFIFWLVLDNLFPIFLFMIAFLSSLRGYLVSDFESLSASDELIKSLSSVFIISSVLTRGVFDVAIVLLFSAIILAAGIDFAKKIGAKLLLLQDGYNLKNDIIKPACLVGIPLSSIAVVANKISSFELLSFFEKSSYSSFHKILIVPFLVITHDIRLLLFFIAGIALLIRTITRSSSIDMIRSASIDMIVEVSIGVVSFFYHMTSPIWLSGTRFIRSNPILFMGPIINCGIGIALGILFWKKGFETAVLCHLIIALIFYSAALVL